MNFSKNGSWTSPSKKFRVKGRKCNIFDITILKSPQNYNGQSQN
jgi:hypothetical protein